jgi:DNA-binding SARP family transcriptional activator
MPREGAVGVAVECRVLGPVSVLVGGEPLRLNRRRERHLLALLLLEVGRPVSTRRLVDLLWPDEQPDDAGAVLHTMVSRLRAALAGVEGFELVRSGGGYAVLVDSDAVDACRFRRLVDEAVREPDAARRAELAAQALALWRGDALADVGDPAARATAGAGLAELRRTALDVRVAADLALGRHEELVGELTEVVAADPLDERFIGYLVVALYRCGRRGDALVTCQRARRRLADQLGLDPGDELQRLEAAVLRGDPVPQAKPVPSKGHAFTVPAQLPLGGRGFVGRVRELAALDAVVDGAGGATVAISAVSGMAGVGKTALAVHWAHRVAHRFPDGQLYVDLRGFDPAARMVSPAWAVRGFLDAMGVPALPTPTGLDAQVGLYRSLLAGKRILVVLDNARDGEQVRPLLPGTPTAMVVVTSRDRLTGLVGTEDARPLPLDLLSTEEARQLLAQRLGEQRVAAEPDAVQEIITACARLPLALTIAAARAQQTGFALATIAAELRQAGRRLDALDAGDGASQVRAVFSGSIAALSPAAARLFRLLGLHPGTELATAAAASLAGQPPAQTRRLLGELARASLLVERAPGRYTCHELLRAYATDLTRRHDPEPDRHAALTRLLDHWTHTAHTADRHLHPMRDPLEPSLIPAVPHTHVDHLTTGEQAMAWLAANHEVLLAALRHAADIGLHTYAYQLAWSLDTFLIRSGHRHALAVAWQAGLEAASRLGDPAAQACAHRSLAVAHVAHERYEDADRHARQALALYRRLRDRVGQGRAHHSLAHLRWRQGDPCQALRHSRRALALFRAAGHECGAANELSSAGRYHADLGNHAEALAYCGEALALLQRLGDQGGSACAWDGLGYAHHRMGNHARAVESYERAVATYRQLGDRQGQADTLARLGDTHEAAGDHDAARDAWRQALDILTDLDHPGTAAVRARLDASTGRAGSPRQ